MINCSTGVQEWSNPLVRHLIQIPGVQFEEERARFKYCRRRESGTYGRVAQRAALP